MLAAAAVIAMAWANSPWQHGYFALQEDVRPVVNDGLMTLFFFVVGLEIKREVVHGELADRRVAALPVFAAAGGMVVPALVHTLVTAGTAGGHGWGIPMAKVSSVRTGVGT